MDTTALTVNLIQLSPADEVFSHCTRGKSVTHGLLLPDSRCGCLLRNDVSLNELIKINSMDSFNESQHIITYSKSLTSNQFLLKKRVTHTSSR